MTSSATRRTGLLVPPRDPDAVAAAVCRVLEDPDWSAALAVAARARVEGEFSVQTMAAKTAAAYARLLARVRTAAATAARR